MCAVTLSTPAPHTLCALQKQSQKIDKLKKLLKDCGIAFRDLTKACFRSSFTSSSLFCSALIGSVIAAYLTVSLQDSLGDRIRKLEAIITDNNVDLSWSMEQRTEVCCPRLFSSP